MKKHYLSITNVCNKFMRMMTFYKGEFDFNMLRWHMANRRRRNLILLFLIILITLSACKTTTFDLYEGKYLKIAVVGEPPVVREKDVSFNKISFDDLNKVELEGFDAVFVMGENLYKAAESQYAHIYLNSSIPFFFISTTSHIPFTEKDIEYEETWGWSPGNSYAVGVLKSNEDDTLKGWGFGLYNDIKTDEHIEEVYSNIFMTIEELDG